MIFYIVENGKIVEKFMCDNHKCRLYNTRDGMPMENTITEFRVVSMQKFDACSPECRDEIKKAQNLICE